VHEHTEIAELLGDLVDGGNQPGDSADSDVDDKSSADRESAASPTSGSRIRSSVDGGSRSVTASTSANALIARPETTIQERTDTHPPASSIA
jgi:hypothetical protein